MGLLGIDQKIENLGDEVREGVREGLTDAWAEIQPKIKKEIHSMVLDAETRLLGVVAEAESQLRVIVEDAIFEGSKKATEQVEAIKQGVLNLDIKIGSRKP